MAHYDGIRDHDLWVDIILGMGVGIAASLFTALILKGKIKL